MSIVDYVGGYEDIAKGMIRVIGQPAQRYKEDPVRMLRTVRFAAALDFSIEDDAAVQMRPLSHMLADVPNARLADELAKIIYSGNSAGTIDLMAKSYLLSRIFPSFGNLMRPSSQQSTLAYLHQLFHDTDQRVVQDTHVSVPYTFAAILWLPFRSAATTATASGKAKGGRLARYLKSLASHVLAEQSDRTFISEVCQNRIREIWRLQRVLHSGFNKSLELGRDLRPALRLMQLRADTGDADSELCERWTQWRDQTEPSSRNARRRKRRRNAGKRR